MSRRSGTDVLTVLKGVLERFPKDADILQPLVDLATPDEHKAAAKVDSAAAMYAYVDTHPDTDTYDTYGYDASFGWYQALLNKFPRVFANGCTVMVNWKGQASGGEDLTPGILKHTKNTKKAGISAGSYPLPRSSLCPLCLCG